MVIVYILKAYIRKALQELGKYLLCDILCIDVNQICVW